MRENAKEQPKEIASTNPKFVENMNHALADLAMYYLRNIEEVNQMKCETANDPGLGPTEGGALRIQILSDTMTLQLIEMQADIREACKLVEIELSKIAEAQALDEALLDAQEEGAHR